MRPTIRSITQLLALWLQQTARQCPSSSPFSQIDVSALDDWNVNITGPSKQPQCFAPVHDLYTTIPAELVVHVNILYNYLFHSFTITSHRIASHRTQYEHDYGQMISVLINARAIKRLCRVESHPHSQTHSSRFVCAIFFPFHFCFFFFCFGFCFFSLCFAIHFRWSRAAAALTVTPFVYPLILHSLFLSLYLWAMLLLILSVFRSHHDAPHWNTFGRCALWLKCSLDSPGKIFVCQCSFRGIVAATHIGFDGIARISV